MAGFLGELITEIFGELAGLFTANKLGWFGKVASKVVTNQAFQGVVAKKTGQFFGLVDESGKTLEEELLTVDLVNFLQQTGSQVDDFISQLCATERGKERATAFRVFLASGLKNGSRQIKEFVLNPANPKKPTEVSRIQLNLEWGKQFIERLLAKNTLEERIQYLDNQGVFSTMKKVSKPHPNAALAKEFLKKTGASIISGQGNNADELRQSYEASKRKLEQSRIDRLNRK